MASGGPEGSGSMGDGWVPSPELLEERELLSGLLDGLADLAAGAPVEEAAVVPDPVAEEPPAVVVPPAGVSASAVAAQAPASAPASLAADSSAEAPAAPGAEAVDSLLANVADGTASHADSAAL